MANGDILTLIDDILEKKGGKGFPNEALRLSLVIQREMYAEQKKLNGRLDAHDKRLERVERFSLLIWVNNHPKLATAIGLAYLFVTAAVDVRGLATAVLQYARP